VVIWRRAPGLIDTWESSQDSGLKGKHPVRKKIEKTKKTEKKIHILHFRPRFPKNAFQTESTTTQDPQTRTTYSPTAYQHRSR